MTNRMFKLPDIGEGVVEGEVVQWHVSVGDKVAEDDALVDVMTDKATVTIPSPHDGEITALHGGVGDMVAVGAVLVEFDGDGDSPASEPVEKAAPEPEPAPSPEPAAAPAPAAATTPVAPPPVPAISAPAPLPSVSAPAPSAGGKALASPAVRRRAREAGNEPGQAGACAIR